MRVWRRVGRAPSASVTEEACLDGHELPVTALALAPCGVLVSGSEDRTVRLWRAVANAAAGWAQRALLEGHTAAVTSLAVRADDPAAPLLTGSWDRTVRVWRCDWAALAPAAACLAVLCDGAPQPLPSADATHAGAGSVLCLALSPDGRHVYAGGGDRLLRVWDAPRLPAAAPAVTTEPQAQQPLRRIECHRRAVTALLAPPPGGADAAARDFEVLSACVDRGVRRCRTALPAAWSLPAHSLYPAGFRVAIVTFLLVMRRGEGALAALGSLDPSTRDGIARLVAAALASDTYGPGGDRPGVGALQCASRSLPQCDEEGEEEVAAAASAQ